MPVTAHNQANVTGFAARGSTPAKIAELAGRPASSVQAQLAKVQREVECGDITSTHHPIGAAGHGRRISPAGFDVSRQDAADYGRALKVLCASVGFTGVYPRDASAPDGLCATDQAVWIYQANIEANRRCALLLANVNDFRGPGEVDSGTASGIGIGFARAFGKPAWSFTRDTGPLIDRAPHHRSRAGELCEPGFPVEDSGFPGSLMIACPARIIAGDAREASEAVRKTPSPCKLNGES